MTPSLSPFEIIKRPLFVPLVLLIAFLLWQDFRRASPISPELLNHKETHEGVITKSPRQKEGKIKLEAGKILLTLGPPLFAKKETPPPVFPLFHKGDQIRFEARLRDPPTGRNPGTFDYRRYLYRQGIGATAFISNPSSIQLVSSYPPSAWERWSANLKEATKRIIAEKSSPAAQGVLIALLWGEESLLDSQTEALFRDQGLAHLLVISGLHFATLSLILYWIFLGVLRLFPKLLLYLPARKIASLATLLILTGYYLFCESSPSITRAYVAIACYLVAFCLNRSIDWLNLLFLAALGILLLQPSALFDLSFQFSFVAVLSLFLILPRLQSEKWQGWIENLKPRLLAYSVKGAVNLLLANAAIAIGLSPLMIHHFHLYQGNGFFMNLWAVPAVELAAVPLGLLALFFESFFPSAAGFLFSIDLKLIEGIIRILEWAKEHLPSPFPVFPPHGWELLVIYGIILLIILKWPPRLKKWGAALLGLILMADVLVVFYRIYWQDVFRITHLDVGQGDAILVELPGPKRILVDGGGAYGFDIGEAVLIPFLLYERIPGLDAVCITHADGDHYGGFASLVQKYRVDEVWWNGIPRESVSYQALLDEAKNRGIPLVPLKRGDAIPVGPHTLIEVLSPTEQDALAAKDNQQSVVLHIRSGRHSALLTGDIEADKESELVSFYGNLLKSDYLKVPHHGSASSNSESFLKAVSPQIATVGARPERYGHPHRKVVERYEKMGIPLYRTDQLGAIVVEFGEKGIWIDP